MSDFDRWPSGGMLSYIKNILPDLRERLLERGFELELYGCDPVGHSKESADYISFMKVKTSRKIIPNSTRCFCSIIKKARKLKRFDVAYSHTETATIALRLIRPKSYIVHHQHGLSYKGAKGFERFHNAERWLAQKMASRVLVVASEKDVSEHARCMNEQDKYYSIGSPIPYNDIVHCDDGKQERSKTVRFIYTGRLAPQKNVQHAIMAFNKFRIDVNPDSEFIILGDGPEKSDLERIAFGLECSSAISFLGNLDSIRVYKELSKADIMLFPSRGEGMSLSVLEALASGLPIVCLDVVGMNSLIVDNQTGFIASDDSLCAFVAAMKKAVEAQNDMKKTCQEFASRYSSEVVAEQIALHLISGEEMGE